MTNTPVYPTQAIELYINGVWENITADVINNIEVSYGINGNTINDRIASIGSMNLTLRNDASCIGGVSGYYSPYTSGAKSGWRTGLPIRLKITYLGQSVIKFYGHISDISPDSGTTGRRSVKVQVSDYMDYLASYPIVLPALKYNEKIEGISGSIVRLLPIQPLSTQYGSGQDVFPTVFDTIKNTGTRALSELTKLALSELGFVYVRHSDATYGEKFVTEGRHTRNNASSVLQVPIPSALSGKLKAEDGTYLLAEDGSFMLLDTLQDMIFDNNMQNLDVSYGTNVFNFIQIKVYPRIVDNVDQIIFSMTSALSLAAGQTKTFTSNYRDPVGNASSVFMKSYTTPVATTDYLMFSNSDGTGTNLTANLSLAGTVYNPGNVSFSVQNTSGSAGYITKLNIRGKGIYIYDPISSSTSGSNSYNVEGYKPLTIDMKYQNDLSTANAMGSVLLSENKDPRLVVNSVNFLANTNNELMQSFLYTDIGDLIFLQETQTKAYGNFYVNNVSYQINPAGIINFTWGLRDSLSLMQVYWTLGTVGQSELGSTTILGF